MLPVALDRQDGSLKALTFKCMTLFHSQRDKKLQNRDKRLSCWRFTEKPSPDLGGQLQDQTAARNWQQSAPTWPLNLLC